MCSGGPNARAEEGDVSECKFCGQPNEGNVGDYYHYHECWQRDVYRRIDEAKSAGVQEHDPEMLRLRRELERASEVGD